MAHSVLHRGRVRWEDGSPVPGALVAVAAGTAPTPEIAIRTNEAGEFRIALPPGKFRIEAHGPHGARGSHELHVSASEVRIEIVLRR